MKKILLIGVAMGANALADEFKPAQVPAKAQWVLHADVAGFKKTQLGKFSLLQLQAVAPTIDGLAGALQFDPRKDLHGITVFGTLAQDGDEVRAKGVVLAHGKFNQVHLLTLLSTNPTFKKERVRGFEIVSWADNGKQSFGAFSGRHHLLVGDDRGLLLEALQVLHGRAAALPAGGLAAMAKGKFFLLQARTEGLPFPQEAKILENVRAVGLAVGEMDKNLVVSARVTVVDAEVSMLVKQAIEGLVAVGRLQLRGIDDPNLRELEALLREVEIGQRKNTVEVRHSVPVKKILDLAREHIGNN